MKIKSSLLAALTILFVQPAFSGNDSPKTIADLGVLPASELKALPDWKVTLGKELSKKDWEGKNEAQLTIMRNSIFAQAGFKFSNPWMHSYFEGRSWYKPTGYDAKKLTKVDHQNVKVLLTYQKARGFALYERHPNKAKRSIAAVTSSNPKADAKLAKKILEMKTCTNFIEGEIKETYSFAKDGKLKVEYYLPSSQEEGSEYGSEYGGEAYGSEYGAVGEFVEGLPKPGTYDGEWRVMEGQVQVKAKGMFEVWNLIMFNADGMKSNLCYRF